MNPVLRTDHLKVHHDTARGTLKAVDGIDLSIAEGETLGLVGESGCGKSTLARCIVGISRPTDGSIAIQGVSGGRGRAARLDRAQTVQMIFQDPSGALNPRLRVDRIIREPLDVNNVGDRSERRDKALKIAREVGLSDYHLDRMPHELSGGQRQRVSIARALALNPKLLVCDEAVSALDVSVQAQVLNLLVDLQKDLGLSYLFISHDLAVVRYVSHRIAVMYMGRIVEIGPAEDVWRGRLHPYTRALTASIPDEAARRDTGELLEGDVPSPVSPPSGCAFRTRCRFARQQCAAERPELRRVGTHEVACHFAETISD
ncbi:ABC transporter ATP-binding protein [Tropicimonas isoalkanivorans]|uniref:Peptide/nickel transport system ATP-binding protein n=1 Tax=Tropicimonas isoalkanivorans TaxID=441112 RepID=A0A1I1KPY5_9RHOB|nr:oligopeptide/dipeptide ABC transporter ATP-binding protein [Tropicimonas isoalkanivorans]SFC62839.1 peptide/nickel transport system ATP-binding protein [Tropicimonas isoalkanivorans]